MHVAARNGSSPDVFTALISNNADVNITTNDRVCTSKVVVLTLSWIAHSQSG